MLRLNTKIIVKDINKAIKTGDLSFGDGKSILKSKLIMIEGNEWLINN